MAKKFVQTYQVSFAKSLDISKDYKRKLKREPLMVSKRFILEIVPKDLFLVEDYLVPQLIPYNLESEVYEDFFKQAFASLADSSRSFKTVVSFWNDEHFSITICFPQTLGSIKNLRFLLKAKSRLKLRKKWKVVLTAYFYLKTYGYFGKQFKRLERVRQKFREKYFKTMDFNKRRNLFRLLLKKKTRFLTNMSLIRGWGETRKMFFPKEKFNSYLGWTKSKFYRLDQFLGEVV